MVKKFLWLGLTLIVFWAISTLFLNSDLYVEIQRWFVESSQLDNGALIIDDFHLARSVEGEVCKRVALNAENLVEVSEFSSFFETGMLMAFETAKQDVEGNYQFKVENQEATIKVDENCWSKDNLNLAWMDYYSKKVFPKFSQFVIPIIKLDGSFKINVDFHQKLEPHPYFGVLSFRLTENLQNRAPAGFSRNIESIGELVIDLSQSDSGFPLQWDRIIGLMISFSGYGELVVGSPKLSK